MQVPPQRSDTGQKPLTPEDRNNAIAHMAETVVPDLTATWTFEPRRTLYVNDKDNGTFCGELFYNVPIFEHGPAVKVRDWVFVMESYIPSARAVLYPDMPPDTWFLSAFRGTTHYTFYNFEKKDRVLTQELLKFVVLRIWPILHPETFGDVQVVDGRVQMHWTTKEFPSAATSSSGDVK